jgi:hypothetical protein
MNPSVLGFNLKGTAGRLGTYSISPPAGGKAAICACCGATEGLERHHAYLKSDGCPDDLTIWLCHICHGSAHSLKRRINVPEATKTALAAAKARGTRLGNPNGLSPEAQAKGASAALRAEQRRIAERLELLRPQIEDIQASGHTTLTAIAAELDAREIEAPRGGTWSAAQVLRLLRQIAAAS